MRTAGTLWTTLRAVGADMAEDMGWSWKQVNASRGGGGEGIGSFGVQQC
jgi:hypothetical protein